MRLLVQEAEASKQQLQQQGAEVKAQSQLLLAKEKVQRLEAQLATAEEVASKSQLAHSSQLRQLTEQQSVMLSQLRSDHETQLKAAAEHHEVREQLNKPAWQQLAVSPAC